MHLSDSDSVTASFHKILIIPITNHIGSGQKKKNSQFEGRILRSEQKDSNKSLFHMRTSKVCRQFFSLGGLHCWWMHHNGHISFLRFICWSILYYPILSFHCLCIFSCCLLLFIIFKSQNNFSKIRCIHFLW